MRSFLARRVLLEDLPRWVARGWRPAVWRDGAVGCTPICDGMLAEVLIVLEPDDSKPPEDRDE